MLLTGCTTYCLQLGNTCRNLIQRKFLVKYLDIPALFSLTKVVLLKQRNRGGKVDICLAR